MSSSPPAGRDPLSDLLRMVRLHSAFFFGIEAAERWRLTTPGARDLAPSMVPGAEHVISLHLVTQGHCFGGLTYEELVPLAPGDVIVFPHGDAHLMTSEEGPGGPVSSIVPARHSHTIVLGGTREPTSVVCGFLGCERSSIGALLGALPRRMVLRGAGSTWLGHLAHRMTDASDGAGPGADYIVTRRAELMLLEVLRHHLGDMPPDHAGWLAGLHDDVVGRALRLIHDRPEYPWGLSELASRALSSRSSLARRFAQFVGQPPMQYLAQWRMHLAANLLSEGSSKVAAVGAEVGYDSEAAFSRAFKRATGLAPGAWRETRRPARRAQRRGLLRSASRQPISLR